VVICGWTVEISRLQWHPLPRAAIEAVQATLGQATRAEWATRFGDLDVCVEPALTLEES